MDLAVVNDVVVERGSSPYLASLDCFCNEQYVTTVQADGIIIATPTGKEEQLTITAGLVGRGRPSLDQGACDVWYVELRLGGRKEPSTISGSPVSTQTPCLTPASLIPPIAGSTAYSMSAGGSMVHPGIQALLLTPICPHSLSFRPLLFPDTATISLTMPTDVRSHVWISFDGKFRHRLMTGDVLEVSRVTSAGAGRDPAWRVACSIGRGGLSGLEALFDAVVLVVAFFHLSLYCASSARAHIPSHPWFDPCRPAGLFPPCLQVSKCPYPLPTVTHRNVTADWFRALNKAFNFNQRTRQKPLTDNCGPPPMG
jgi:hypothetical protein